MYISRLLGIRDWYLPDFLCGIVPDTLRHAGIVCIPYRPGRLKETLRSGRVPRVAVASWDVDGAPPSKDLEILASGDTIFVEDRCQWAGMPWHVERCPENVFAVGSVRKWLGVAEGGWITSGRQPGLIAPDGHSDLPNHAVAQLAASVLRRLRIEHEDDGLEQSNLVCSDLAESTLGVPDEPRGISRLGLALVKSLAGNDSERMLRLELARQVQKLAGGSLELSCGIVGLRLYCNQRDALEEDLARLRVFAPVHWRDGDWSGSGGIAEALAKNTITLPCPALANQASRDDYLERLESVLKAYDYRIVSVNRPD